MRILYMNDKKIVVFNDNMIMSKDDISDLIVKVVSNCKANLLALDLTKLNPVFFDKSSGMIEYFFEKAKIDKVKTAIFGDYSSFDVKATNKYLIEKGADKYIFLTATKADAMKLLQEK